MAPLRYPEKLVQSIIGRFLDEKAQNNSRPDPRVAGHYEVPIQIVLPFIGSKQYFIIHPTHIQILIQNHWN